MLLERISDSGRSRKPEMGNTRSEKMTNRCYNVGDRITDIWGEVAEGPAQL